METSVKAFLSSWNGKCLDDSWIWMMYKTMKVRAYFVASDWVGNYGGVVFSITYSLTINHCGMQVTSHFFTISGDRPECREKWIYDFSNGICVKKT